MHVSKLICHYTSKNYEQIFEDDLRLFLFDQGIDYPFSTPKSTSGRADIVGSIDTSDPIVLEIKIFDRVKNYGKNRIIDGFSQIMKYANNYNKETGYLVIFNAEKADLCCFALQGWRDKTNFNILSLLGSGHQVDRLLIGFVIKIKFCSFK